MSSWTSPDDPLVAHLERLEAREDRASLAALRASLQDGRALEGLRVVLPFVRRSESDFAQRRAEDDALLLGGLFALNPESGSLTLADAMRIVAGDSDSVEQRFLALLGARRDDLASHLRHAVSLVGSKKLALDWRNLAWAIRGWDRDDDRVRRFWAQRFWTAKSEENGDGAGSDSSANDDNNDRSTNA